MGELIVCLLGFFLGHGAGAEGRGSEDGGGRGRDGDRDRGGLGRAGAGRRGAPTRRSYGNAATGSFFTGAVRFAADANTNFCSTAASRSGRGCQSQVALPGSGWERRATGAHREWALGSEGGDKEYKRRWKKRHSISPASSQAVIGGEWITLISLVSRLFAATPNSFTTSRTHPPRHSNPRSLSATLSTTSTPTYMTVSTA
ncbi:hypothetical protein FB451DRAFT_1177975 [Mycena latifolia]|nr:hypothetical protein FB451DRAFT_1177975 [Mycena latifolia]